MFFLIFYVFATLASGKYVDVLFISVSGVDVRFSQVIMLVLVLLVLPLIISFKKNDMHVIRPVMMYLAAGMLAMTIGVLRGNFDWKFLVANFGIYLYSIFFIFGYYLIDSAGRLEVLLKTVFLASLIGIVVFIVVETNLSGTLPIGIHLSSDILPLASGAIAVFLVTYKDRIISRKKDFFLFCFFLGFVIFTQTRGVLLAVFVVLFFVHVRNIKLFKQPIVIVILTSAATLVLLGALLLWQTNLDHLIEKSREDVGFFDIVYRYIMYAEILEQIISRPIFGHGIVPFVSESIKFYFPEMPSEGVNPHNSFLLLAYFSGLAGAFMLAWALKGVYFTPEKLNGNMNVLLGMKCATLVVLVDSFSTPILEIHYVAPVFWITLGTISRVGANSELFSRHHLPSKVVIV